MIEMITILLMIVVWSVVPMMSYEFYTTTKENRYRFRYWFSIGMLNLYLLILGAIYRHTGIEQLQEARWMAFVVIDVLLLETFIKPVIRRKLELFIRVSFYMLVILENAIDNPIPLILAYGILVYLSANSDCVVSRKHFKWTFLLYMFVAIIPYIFGFSTEASLLMGLIYSIHIVWGVHKLYHEEKTLEEIKKQLQVGEE